jgi:hypothetical protein
MNSFFFINISFALTPFGMNFCFKLTLLIIIIVVIDVVIFALAFIPNK